MRWIVISKSKPAQLHALLQSASLYLPACMPSVICIHNENRESQDAYNMACNCFSGSWIVTNNFKDDLIDVVCRPGKRGGVEQLTLITTDTMLFRQHTNMREAWHVVLDRNMLGLSLSQSPEHSCTFYSERRFANGSARTLTWSWPFIEHESNDDPLHVPFNFGTVYRTNDLIGPLCEANYNSPESMRESLCSSTAFHHRPWLACLPEMPLLDVQAEDAESIRKYLDGFVIDIEKLAIDQSKYHWKLYEEN